MPDLLTLLGAWGPASNVGVHGSGTTCQPHQTSSSATVNISMTRMPGGSGSGVAGPKQTVRLKAGALSDEAVSYRLEIKWAR